MLPTEKLRAITDITLQTTSEYTSTIKLGDVFVTMLRNMLIIRGNMMGPSTLCRSSLASGTCQRVREDALMSADAVVVSCQSQQRRRPRKIWTKPSLLNNASKISLKV